MVKVKVRPTHNFAGHGAGSVITVDPSELERWPDVLERYVEPAPDLRGPRPTRESMLEHFGATKDEELTARDQRHLERALAHEQLDWDRGWGDYDAELLAERARLRALAEREEAEQKKQLGANVKLTPRKIAVAEKLEEALPPPALTAEASAPPTNSDEIGMSATIDAARAESAAEPATAKIKKPGKAK